MSENRKEEIILATLKLASEKGLKAVSMNMISEEVGIKKPSLYNHFASKEQLVNEMYLFLKEQAKKQTNTQMDFSIFENKSACEILQQLVQNYVLICDNKNMKMFYKVIYSERTFSSDAAKIVVQETEKMIGATKQVLQILENKKLLHFENIDVCATSFALTINSLLNYSFDKSFVQNQDPEPNMNMINAFIVNFCKEHE